MNVRARTQTHTCAHIHTHTIMSRATSRLIQFISQNLSEVRERERAKGVKMITLAQTKTNKHHK